MNIFYEFILLHYAGIFISLLYCNETSMKNKIVM